MARITHVVLSRSRLKFLDCTRLGVMNKQAIFQTEDDYQAKKLLSYLRMNKREIVSYLRMNNLTFLIVLHLQGILPTFQEIWI